MIQVKDLSKAFGERRVLNRLTFAVTRPMLLSAPSGAGKTTLLRILMGLDKPDSGIAHADGRIAAVFQEDRLIPQLTAAQNIRLTAHREIPDEELARAFAAVNLSGIELTIPAARLSGGQKRRVALLRALLCEADCLLLDEPFTGLDEENQSCAVELTRRLVGERPCLLVCHDNEAAKALGWEKITL